MFALLWTVYRYFVPLPVPTPPLTQYRSLWFRLRHELRVHLPFLRPCSRASSSLACGQISFCRPSYTRQTPRSNGVKARFEPHRISSTPWEEAQRRLHTNLEWSRNGRRIFIGHTSKILRKSIEGLACGVVAKEDAVLEISGWISGIFVIISIYYGFGTHQAEILVKPDGMQDLINAAFWQTTGYSFHIGCYSLSVAGQVLHYRSWLFHNVRSHSILIRVMKISGMVQVLFGVLCVICVFAKCTPVEGNWNPTVDSKCWKESIFLGINYSSSAITFVSYTIQGWIPIHMALSLGKSSITRNQWIALSVIAFWNVVAGVLALVKLSYLGLYVVTEDATWRRVILVQIGLAENRASGIVPSAAEMWVMAQQIMNRSPDVTGNSRTGNGNQTHLERPQSASSELELTSNKAKLGQGITKTMAWETSTGAQQDAWSNVSESESCRRGDVAQVRSNVSHSGS